MLAYFALDILLNARRYNFPPHLSRVATLPENTLATKQVRGSEKIIDVATK